MFSFDIPPSLYNPIYMWMVFAFCTILCIMYSGSKNSDNLLKKRSVIPALILIVLLILFLGNRPLGGRYFGDTSNYAMSYKLLTVKGSAIAKMDTETEWLWQFIMEQCKFWKLETNAWFIVIATGYFGLVFLAFKRMVNEGVWLAMLFFLSAFSTYTYAINGIRNGFACSFVILALSYAVNANFSKNNSSESKEVPWHLIIAFILGFLAFGIHRSTILPLTSAVIAIFVIKNPKYALYFWIACIPLSLVFGSAATSFFAGLGFDDRMSGYAVDASQSGVEFSHTGFRWDFLLYSGMPALLVWYVNKKIEEHEQKVKVKKADDVPEGTGYIADANSMKLYNILATTYLLSNAFWIMVCRAAFSNRFAYLSWFLYPVLIAFTVLRLHIWKDQDNKAAWILMAHVGFSMLMFLKAQ